MQSYKKMSTEELVVLSQNNDIKALEELIRQEQKCVFATFAKKKKKRENAADLTQEALLRAAKSINSLKNPKCFKSWLNHIITNVFYDDLRKIQRKPEVLSVDENKNETTFDIPDTHCTPNEKCLSLELGQLIKDAINSLPEAFRIVIVLREIQGLTYEQIAEVTKTEIGTVKSRIARARIKLQEGLKAYI